MLVRKGLSLIKRSDFQIYSGKEFALIPPPLTAAPLHWFTSNKDEVNSFVDKIQEEKYFETLNVSKTKKPMAIFFYIIINI